MASGKGLLRQQWAAFAIIGPLTFCVPYSIFYAVGRQCCQFNHADDHFFTMPMLECENCSFRPLEQCEAAGCMVEIVTQLAVIMIGKQIFNASFEIGHPMLSYWVR